MQEMGSSPPKSLLHPPPAAARAMPGAQSPRETHLIVGETSSREDGDLLAPGNAIHHINGGDPCLDHLLRVDAAVGVDGLAWGMRRERNQPWDNSEQRNHPPKLGRSFWIEVRS